MLENRFHLIALSATTNEHRRTYIANGFSLSRDTGQIDMLFDKGVLCFKVKMQLLRKLTRLKS
jgi:hypothetical protein